MNWDAIGAIGDFVGGLGVVLSLVYIAFQIRQNSRQIDQNSRQLEASMFHASGEGFNHWWSLLVSDQAVADLWLRGIAGKDLTPPETMQFRSLAMMLFTTLESNFHLRRIGAHNRDTLSISKPSWVNFLSSPGGSAWWQREARRSFMPEFVDAVEALIHETTDGREAIDEPSSE